MTSLSFCSSDELGISQIDQFKCDSCDPGRGRPRRGGATALISTIENSLDIQGKTAKSAGFSPNVLENKILEKFLR